MYPCGCAVLFPTGGVGEIRQRDGGEERGHDSSEVTDSGGK